MHFGERICRVRVEPAARASDGKDGSCQEARAYKRRPRSIDATKIKRIMDEGVGASAVAKKLGIGRASPLKLPKCARKGLHTQHQCRCSKPLQAESLRFNRRNVSDDNRGDPGVDRVRQSRSTTR